MNMLKMTLKFWGSGLLALLVMAISMAPISLIDQENRTLAILGYLLIGLIIGPIAGGAAQHWFWKDHDWKGVS